MTFNGTKAELLEINERLVSEVSEHRTRFEETDDAWRRLKHKLEELKESQADVLLEKDQQITFLRRVVEELLWILKKAPK